MVPKDRGESVAEEQKHKSRETEGAQGAERGPKNRDQKTCFPKHKHTHKKHKHNTIDQR